MSTEFYNTQWQMPNEANKSKRNNYSLQRTDANQYIQVDSVSINSGPSFTISCWVFGADIDTSGLHAFWGTEHYGTTNGGFVIYYGSGGVTFYSSLPGSGSYFTFATASNLLVDNVWQQVTIRYNYGVDYRIYINNVLRAVNTTNNSVIWPQQNIRLFRHYSNDGYNHDGALSDWCFFNYALSDTATSVGDTTTGQIAQLYGNGSSLSNPMDLSPAPKAYYKLSDSVWDGDKYITANNAAQDYVFNFSGANDRVYGPTGIFSGQTATTISFWVNVDDFSTTQNLFANGSYPYFRLMSNGTFNITWPVNGNNFQSFASGMTAGKWHLFVFKWQSGSKYQIYIDNDLKGESTSTITGSFPSSNTGSLELANGVDNLDLQGKISNFKTWNVALTTNELTTLYNYGSPIQTLASIPQNSNLKVWYKLDASEVYNSSSTDWSIDNNQNPSAYPSSLNFNAQSLVAAQDSSLESSVFSVSMWIKIITSPVGTFQSIFFPGTFTGAGGFRFQFKGNGSPPFIDFATTFDTGATANISLIDDGGWHHIVGTYNGSTLKLYIDKNKGTDASYSFQVSGANFFIGQAGNQNFSNVCYFNTALSQSEIDTLYNNGTPLTDMSSFSSLVSWWKLNNITTGIQDSKGSNNLSGSGPTEYAGFVNTLAGDSLGMSQSNLVQSDLQTVAAYSKYAINFDGTDYIDCGNSQLLDYNSSFTISAWVYMTGVTGYDVILTFKGNSKSFVLSRNASNMGVYAGTIFGIADHPQTMIKSGQDITNNKWNNLVIVYNGNGITSENNYTFYINNSSQTLTNTGANGYTDYENVNNIGRFDTNYFTGNLSNVAIWNSELNASQVKEIYNEGLPSNLNSHSAYSNLVSWWKLGEGVSYDGTYLIAQDYKGNNHGTSNSSMDQTDIINGVGTSLNGASSGFSAPSTTVTNITTDAPYSDKNAVSVNMQSAKSGSGIDTSTPQAT